MHSQEASGVKRETRTGKERVLISVLKSLTRASTEGWNRSTGLRPKHGILLSPVPSSYVPPGFRGLCRCLVHSPPPPLDLGPLPAFPWCHRNRSRRHPCQGIRESLLRSLIASLFPEEFARWGEKRKKKKTLADVSVEFITDVPLEQPWQVILNLDFFSLPTPLMRVLTASTSIADWRHFEHGHCSSAKGHEPLRMGSRSQVPLGSGEWGAGDALKEGASCLGPLALACTRLWNTD